MFRRKSTRRRLLRYGLIGVNALVVIAVLGFVFASPGASGDSQAASLAANPADGDNNPLDSLSSSEIAAAAAQLAGLPETPAVVNQADSDQAQLHMIAASNNVVTKPQVVASDYLSNKDIKTYVAKNGDTLASVAKKFGLSQDTLRWSNSLSSTILKAGQKLLIPPVNGLVYTVKKGDTPTSLATKFSASEAQVTAYNDAELKGLKIGERVIIPGGTKPAPVYSSYASTGYGGGYGSGSGSGFAWGSSPVYGSNGYDFGECTWYVATQIPVPANWGNAATWAYYAGQTPGWNVNSIPRPGAIAQNSYSAGGFGHVAIVDAVSADGSMLKITDMNGIAGWDRVGTAWQPTSTYQHFISR